MLEMEYAYGLLQVWARKGLISEAVGLDEYCNLGQIIIEITDRLD